jgi:hypothetical protein
VCRDKNLWSRLDECSEALNAVSKCLSNCLKVSLYSLINGLKKEISFSLEFFTHIAKPNAIK